ncbi:MAG: NAD(P)-dependent oxidoreductase [Scytolyngbya sp. HA4215-MV1]|jgi:dTDP-4-dehydrorhamnose reductase|nr:NAD(P)-dependent oxidoreductase [Scytolyngbya sp. HA4215-MV1]
MQRLLVTGASGFLGWHVCQLAKQNWQVYGTYANHAIAIPGATLLKADLVDFQALKQLVQIVQPDAVIHTAARSAPNDCQKHPQETQAINVTASLNLAGLCADRAISCAFTSTDLVFDGKSAPYREMDAVCPLSVYGEQKVLAEQGMLSRYPQTMVCRMPLMFGAATPTASSFMQPFIQALREGRGLRLFVDEFRTPASAVTAAQGLLLAIGQKGGYLHLGGKERVSRYEFGRLMVEMLNLPEAGLQACRQQDMPMAAPRPADVSLDSTIAFALGYAPPSLREEFALLRAQV